MNNRDEFSPEVKEKLAQRVGLLCSRCGCATSGPHENPAKTVNIGVAAHITAASPGGPRYDESLTKEQRSDISNGIWLCQFCAKLADNDVIRFPVERVRLWKHGAEQRRRQCIEEETLFPSDSFQPRFFELQQQLFDRITSSITFPSASLFEKNLAFFLKEEVELMDEIEAILDGRNGERLALLVGNTATGKTVIACQLGRKFQSDRYHVFHLRLDSVIRFADIWNDMLATSAIGEVLFILEDCHLNSDIARGK